MHAASHSLAFNYSVHSIQFIQSSVIQFNQSANQSINLPLLTYLLTHLFTYPLIYLPVYLLCFSIFVIRIDTQLSLYSNLVILLLIIKLIRIRTLINISCILFSNDEDL